jgi:hypothetical protein
LGNVVFWVGDIGFGLRFPALSQGGTRDKLGSLSEEESRRFAAVIVLGSLLITHDLSRGSNSTGARRVNESDNLRQTGANLKVSDLSAHLAVYTGARLLPA